MTTLLNYGEKAQLTLELPAGSLVAHCGQPPVTSLVDAATLVTQALDAPLDFPSLAQAVVPGDRVVVALGSGVPEAAKIVAAVIERLTAVGVDLSQITLLVSQPETANGGFHQADLPPAYRDALRTLTHDPEDREGLSYLAASNEGKPIYINRALSQADLVLPIGCLRPTGSMGNFGLYASIFPAFSDARTLARYRSPSALRPGVQHRRLCQSANEVGWLLGLQLLLEVLPGPAAEVLAVCCGRAESVERVGREMADAAWACQVPRRASLVIAALEGRGEQTWDNFGRALAAASRVVAPGGSIVLCTELEQLPGPGLQALRGAEQPEEVLSQIQQVRPFDSLVAVTLIRALEQSRVYLLSRLDSALVEELGMAAVDDAASIVRLASRHSSFVVLSNAQYVAVQVLDDEAPLEDEQVEAALEEARDEFE